MSFMSLVKKKTNLSIWIIIFMAIGIIVGSAAPQFSVTWLKPFANLFIRMIQAIEVPLIFCTLVVGIAGHGDDLKKTGLLALQSLIYFEVVTTFALIIGLVVVNLARPGDGITLANTTNSTSQLAEKSHDVTLEAELYTIVPTSFFDVAARNVVLAIVFCAVMFAVALFRVDKKTKKTMLDFNEGISLTMFKVVELIMNYAPFAIGCAIAATVGASGLGVLANLAKLIGTLYDALIIFVALVFLPILLLTRVPVMEFLRAVSEPFLIAFSTASSESALPKALKNMEAFGVPSRVVSFVLPTGYSFNLDGTTLYLSVASIFAAQAGNIELPIVDQILIMLTLMLTSKGVAAVPRASLVILAGTLQQYNLPLGAISLILGVDTFMDMARTSVNVLGNCLASVAMARLGKDFRSEEWERDMERERANQASAQETHEDVESKGGAVEA